MAVGCHHGARRTAIPLPSRLPWNFYPALTEDRLRICARLLANARREALAMAGYELGDGPRSVGCRAFAFGRHRLERASRSGEYPWLKVLDDSPHFVFVIGSNGQGVPVRFYRGAADEPAECTLRRQEIKVQQLSPGAGRGGRRELGVPAGRRNRQGLPGLAGDLTWYLMGPCCMGRPVWACRVGWRGGRALSHRG
jgi:hypothetical protein